jgi:hypothetical protein
MPSLLGGDASVPDPDGCLVRIGYRCATKQTKDRTCVIDDREYSDASASRFRAPLDKGPVNGWPLSFDSTDRFEGGRMAQKGSE